MVLVEWLHVLLAMFWFGGTLYMNVVVIPTLLKQPLEQQRSTAFAIGVRTSKVFPWVQTAATLVGVLRGTVYGPIHSLSDLGSPYGQRFIVALVLTVVLAGFGHGVTGPAARKLGEFPAEEVIKGTGPVAEAYLAQTKKVRLYSISQLVMFVVIFTIMILMRFGQ